MAGGATGFPFSRLFVHTYEPTLSELDIVSPEAWHDRTMNTICIFNHAQ